MSCHAGSFAPELIHHVAADGYRCQVRRWQPPQATARIVLIHGLMSHGGWYLRGCRHLARAGFEVHALDRRGSGLNVAQRGDVPSWDVWMTDVMEYLTSLPATRANIVLGVCWGAKLALALAIHWPEHIAAVGLLCPGLFAQRTPGNLKYLGIHAAAAMGLQSMQVPIPLQDPALFTSTPRWKSYIRTDPFTLRKVTLRAALADRQMTRMVIQSPRAVRQPVFLALSGRDRITANQRTLDYFHRLGTPDRTLREYPRAAHTIEFEHDPVPFLNDVAAWAKKVAAASSAGQDAVDPMSSMSVTGRVSATTNLTKSAASKSKRCE